MVAVIEAETGGSCCRCGDYMYSLMTDMCVIFAESGILAATPSTAASPGPEGKWSEFMLGWRFLVRACYTFESFYLHFVGAVAQFSIASVLSCVRTYTCPTISRFARCSRVLLMNLRGGHKNIQFSFHKIK